MPEIEWKGNVDKTYTITYLIACPHTHFISLKISEIFLFPLTFVFL